MASPMVTSPASATSNTTSSVVHAIVANTPVLPGWKAAVVPSLPAKSLKVDVAPPL